MRTRTVRWSFLPSIILALTALSLLVACGSKNKSSNAPTEVQLDQSADGTTVEIASGGKLIIALPSNPTTGYSWAVVDPTGGLTQQGDPAFVPAGSTQPVVGAGGTEVFTFTAGDQGEYKLGLAYARSFEPTTTPDQTFSVTVTVK